MKIRSGFVSNSSSSSFIVRGFDISLEEAEKFVGKIPSEDSDNEDDPYPMIQALEKYFEPYKVFSKRPDFDPPKDDPDYNRFIIGEEICSLDDGHWGELADTREIDIKMIKAFMRKGAMISPKTYAYYLSNDNY